MAIPDAPYLRFLRTFVVDLLALSLPTSPKHFCGQFPCASNTCEIVLVKYVHNLVRSDQCLVLQRRVTRQRIGNLAQGREVQKEAPCFLIGYDKVCRCKAEVTVHLCKGMSVPSCTFHADNVRLEEQ